MLKKPVAAHRDIIIENAYEQIYREAEKTREEMEKIQSIFKQVLFQIDKFEITHGAKPTHVLINRKQLSIIGASFFPCPENIQNCRLFGLAIVPGENFNGIHVLRDE